jgi:O-antigen/teichoic acid export membrane protein
MLNGLAHTLFYSVDRILVALFLGSHALGIYGLALMLQGFLAYIPVTIYQVMFPRIMEKASVTKNIRELEEFWFDPLYFVLHTMPIAIGMIWIVSPVFLRYLLPKYVDALSVIRIVALAIFFASMLGALRLFLVALNKQKSVLVFYSGAIIVNVLINLLMIRMGYGIEGVAVATGISFFILGSSLLIYVLGHFERNSRNTAKTFAVLYFPFLYALVILVLITRFTAEPYLHLQNDFLQLLFQSAAFALLASPLLYLTQRRSGILGAIASQVFEESAYDRRRRK